MKKAYKATCDYVDYAEIVFADTPGRAKKLALSGELFDDVQYVDIRVNREPGLDICWGGRDRMDWYDPADRAILCDRGWYCAEPDLKECRYCPVADKCDWYRGMQEDEE